MTTDKGAGEQVFLRAMEPEDLDFLYEMENDELLWAVGNTNVPYSRQVLLDYITSATADIYTDKQVRFIIENRQHEPLGIVDLMNFDPRHLRAELGIVVRREWQGRGIAQAAIRHLMQYAKEILHLHQIYAIVGEHNQKAARMLEKLGFQGDKILKEWLSLGDMYEDAHFFQCFL